MKKLLVVACAAALLVGVAAPASAQTLGVLELDEHQGHPGDVVSGSVQTDVVDRDCIMDPEDFLPLFIANSSTGPEDGQIGPVFQAWADRGPLVGIEPPADDDWPGVELAPGFWFDGAGPPQQDAPPQNWAMFVWRTNSVTWADETGWGPYTREQQAAGAVMNVFRLLGQSGGSGPTLRANLLWPATFVFAFADIETSQPIGELSNFDPLTGQTVDDPPLVVPDIEPGVHPVIATCIDFNITDETFMNAVEAVAAHLEETGVEPDANPVGQSIAESVAPVALAQVATPGGGPWVDLYCVLDDDGVCHPDLRGIDIDDLTEEELEEFLEELLAEEADDAADAALVAETEPRFTG